MTPQKPEPMTDQQTALPEAVSELIAKETNRWQYNNDTVGARISFDSILDRIARIAHAAATDQERARLQATEDKYRALLWANHGHRGIYGDDGEMQCDECMPEGVYDYKRAPLADVERVAGIAKQKQIAEARRYLVQNMRRLEVCAGRSESGVDVRQASRGDRSGARPSSRAGDLEAMVSGQSFETDPDKRGNGTMLTVQRTRFGLSVCVSDDDRGDAEIYLNPTEESDLFLWLAKNAPAEGR